MSIVQVRERERVPVCGALDEPLVGGRPSANG
jgi:hypothetical protein